MKHPYADILIAIANGEPVQISYDEGNTWSATKENYVLSRIADEGSIPRLSAKLRVKPKTILINGHEVPEPMKEKPQYNATYYYPSFVAGVGTPLQDSYWTNDELDNARFNRGLIHSTKEAAIKHAEALISFTKVKE